MSKKLNTAMMTIALSLTLTSFSSSSDAHERITVEGHCDSICKRDGKIMDRYYGFGSQYSNGLGQNGIPGAPEGERRPSQKKETKEQCVAKTQQKSITCQKEIVSIGVGAAIVCMGAGVLFTPPAGVACGAVMSGAAAYDVLDCQADQITAAGKC